MFDIINSSHADLQSFLWDNFERLQNASLLLGGRPALSATKSLIADICSKPELTHRDQIGLVRLHKLLTLEYVHDFDRPESAYFAVIDPAEPYIEEICLLADQLADRMTAVAQASGIEMEAQEVPYAV